MIFTSCFLGLIVGFSGLSLAVFTQFMFDQYLSDLGSHKTFLALGLVSLILLFRSFLSYVRNLLISNHSESFNNKFFNHFFGQLGKLPLTFFESKSTGDVVARMHEAVKIQSLISTFFGQIIVELFLLVGIVSFLFFQSVILGLILIVTALAYLAIAYRTKDSLVRLQRGAMSAYGVCETTFIETQTGALDIKSNQRESYFSRVNQQFYTNFQNRLLSFNLFKTKVTLSLDLISTISICLIAWLAITQFQDRLISTGSLVAILQICLLIPSSLAQIFYSNLQVNEAITAYSRIHEFTSLINEDDQRENGERLTSIENISVKELSYKYPGRSMLFENLSFTASKGEILRIVGPTGSGKTTFFKILQCFYKSTSGAIHFNDSLDINDTLVSDIRSKVAYVPQEIKIFNGSLLFNIALDSETTLNDMNDFCVSVGFANIESFFPDGFNSIVGEFGIKLSGGQKQIIGLLRALYKKPDVIILDEVTSQMDWELEKSVRETIKLLHHKTITIIASHRDEWNSIVDKTISLNRNISREIMKEEIS